VHGLDIAGRNVSCDEVGGDYYDFFLQQENVGHSFSVAVGDITGHGVDAALLMTSARAFLRMHASRDESIVEIVRLMNRVS
jgi:sigma-B regulation protein RsbU (phosphoserine phosphatase)